MAMVEISQGAEPASQPQCPVRPSRVMFRMTENQPMLVNPISTLGSTTPLRPKV